MTTRPFCRWRTALSFTKSSAMDGIESALCTLAGTPICSSTSQSANAFITVASIPMWSARLLSMLPLLRPRQKFPPPTTMASSTPSSVHFLMLSQIFVATSKSIPMPFSPASASPESLSKMRLYLSSNTITPIILLKGADLLITPILYYFTLNTNDCKD